MPDSNDEYDEEDILHEAQQEFLELMIDLGVKRPAWNSAESWNG